MRSKAFLVRRSETVEQLLSGSSNFPNIPIIVGVDDKIRKKNQASLKNMFTEHEHIDRIVLIEHVE